MNVLKFSICVLLNLSILYSGISQEIEKIKVNEVSVRLNNSDQKTNPSYQYMRELGNWKMIDSIIYEKSFNQGDNEFSLEKLEFYIKDFIITQENIPDTNDFKLIGYDPLYEYSNKNEKGVTTVTYRNERNLPSGYYSDSYHFTYDSLNRLIQVQISGTSRIANFTYKYDADNKLIITDSGHNQFRYEYDENGLIKFITKYSRLNSELYKDSFLDFTYVLRIK